MCRRDQGGGETRRVALSVGTPEHTARKVAVLPLGDATRVEVAPLLARIAMCNTQIDEADDRLTLLAATSAPARLLQSMPMIGPVTALGFVAALDDIARFPSASHVAAYLGLVPSEYSSGERQQRATSRNAAIRAPDGCSSKPRGASCGRSIPPSPHGNTGRRGSSPGAVAGSRSWRWPAVWRRSVTQCGARIHRITRLVFSTRHWRGSRNDCTTTDCIACMHDEMTDRTRRRVL